MLAEFLITPDIFDASDEVLRTRLGELREVLLPRGSAPKLMVCQLGSEVWFKAVSARIAAISNADLRSNAKHLFERIVNSEDGISVKRPLPESITPNTENEWISAGEVSSRKMAFDGIVASECYADSDLVLPVKQFTSDEYNERFPNPRFVERTEEAQALQLRTICLHSDWLILRLPQIRGGCDDEIVTAKQVLSIASQRLKGQTKCAVELHACCHKDSFPIDRLKRAVETELISYKKHLAELKVKIFPKSRAFIDREVLGGVLSPMPNNYYLRSARWLIAMTHVAIGKRLDSPSGHCTWSLYGRKSAHARLKQIEESLLPNE